MFRLRKISNSEISILRSDARKHLFFEIMDKDVVDFLEKRREEKNDEDCMYRYECKKFKVLVGLEWNGSLHDADFHIIARVDVARKGFSNNLRKRLREARKFFMRLLRKDGSSDLFSVLKDVNKDRNLIKAVSRWELSRKNA